jgi:hypothetical protein
LCDEVANLLLFVLYSEVFEAFTNLMAQVRINDRSSLLESDLPERKLLPSIVGRRRARRRG